jgi:TrmH family RNA methyltransferase
VSSRRFSPEFVLGPKSDVVTGARDLLTARNRKSRAQFLAEGPQSVSAVIAAGWAISVLAVEEHLELLETAQDESIRAYLITQSAASALSDTVNSQGVFAVCRIPEVSIEDLDLESVDPFVVCVGISDPGNLGTIIRTAAASGAKAVVTTTGSADIWNGKVLRSAAGTFTNIPVIGPLDLDVLLEIFKRNSVTTIATAGSARDSIFSATSQEKLQKPHAWLLGSEAHGLDASVIAEVDHSVFIPMRGDVESLNVATSAAICLYSSQLSIASNSPS